MSVALLLDGDLARYQALHADTAEALWLFLHIPKTAGTSFRSELAQRLRPEANIAVDYRDESRPFHLRLSDAVTRFLDEQPQQGYRFASGHIHRHQAALIEATVPQTRLFTMLRDPVLRVVSDYRYQRTPAHPPWQSFIEQFPDFESYVRSPVSQNKHHDYLKRAPGDPVERVIADMERSFVFVGFTEHYELSCRILFRLLGVASPPTRFERRTEDRADNRIENLDRFKALIRNLNPLDVAIHEHFRVRFAKQMDALRAHFGS